MANSYKLLRNTQILGYLKPRLESTWKLLQMDGEEALARVAITARLDPSSLSLHAQSIILKVTGKLKDADAGGMDALALALTETLKKNGVAPTT